MVGASLLGMFMVMSVCGPLVTGGLSVAGRCIATTFVVLCFICVMGGLLLVVGMIV